MDNIKINKIQELVGDEISDEQALALLEKKSNEYMKLMSYYRCAIMEIETKLRVLDTEYSLKYDRNPINSIKTRLKTLRSIKEKLDRLGCELTFESMEENLNDIAGVRVVCSFKEDVYTLAQALLKQDDINIVSCKDYIKNPKPNGYRSLHLIVEIPIYLANEKKLMRVEIQLRTIAMDFWASLEHQLRYKKDFVFTEDMSAELAECATISALLDDRMDNLRNDIETNTALGTKCENTEISHNGVSV